MLFSDIKDHWAKTYIEKLAGYNAFDKCVIFRPDDIITNAEFVKMIMRVGYGKIESQDEYFSGYMYQALRRFIISDIEAEFPESAVTRRAAARIIHEMLKKRYDEPDDENWQDAETLADLYSCHTCVMHIAQVYIKGIMSSYGDGEFHVDDVITRAEAAAAVMRMIEPSLRIRPIRAGRKAEVIPAEQVYELMKNGAVMIDVRSTEDHAAGHIKGSISIPVTAVMEDIDTAMSGIDPATPIIVYCGFGTNSRRTARMLSEDGYKNVYDMGGIASGKFELIAE